MAAKVIRMIIPDDLYKRYKLQCVLKDLTMPKQTAELIRKFVEVQEQNDERLKGK